MGRLEPGEGYDGAKRERGFLPIDNTGEGLFKGLPVQLTVWHNHCDEGEAVTERLSATASNETCEIQAMQEKGRRVYGVQFHPELFDGKHPEGRQHRRKFPRPLSPAISAFASKSCDLSHKYHGFAFGLSRTCVLASFPGTTTLMLVFHF